MATTSARIGIKFDGAQSIKDVANNLVKANQEALKAGKSFEQLSTAEQKVYRDNEKMIVSLKNTDAALKSVAVAAAKAAKGFAAIAHVKSPFSVLAADATKARQAIANANASIKRTSILVEKAQKDSVFEGSIRNAKAAILLQDRLNAEYEKQAHLTARIALEQNKGSQAAKWAAKDLRVAQAKTKELERQAGATAQLIAKQQRLNAIIAKSKATVWARKYGKDLDMVSAKTVKAGVHTRSFFQDLSKGALASTGKIWMAYAGNIAAMTAGFVAASVAVSSFTEAVDLQYLLRYSKAIGDMGDNAESVGGSLQDMTKHILSIKGVTAMPVELAKGFRELVKAGKETSEIIDGELVKSLSHFASVAEMDLAKAVQLSVTQVNAFKDVTTDAAGGVFDFTDAADMMAAAVFDAPIAFEDLAQSLKHTTELAVTVGASFDEIVTAISLMGEAGIKGSQAGTALRTALTKLVTPTKDLSSQIEILGGNLRDAFDEDGTMNVQNAIGLYKDMYDQLDSIAKVKFIKDVFGLRSQKAIAAMMKSFDQWDEKHDKILESQGNIEAAYAEIRKTAAIAGKEFKSAFSIELKKSLLPILDKLPPLIDLATKNVKGLVAVIKLATTAAGLFAAVWTGGKMVRAIGFVSKAVWGIVTATTAANGAALTYNATLKRTVALRGGLAGVALVGGAVLGADMLKTGSEQLNKANTDVETLKKSITEVEARIVTLSSKSSGGWENSSAGLRLANTELDQLKIKLEAATKAATNFVELDPLTKIGDYTHSADVPNPLDTGKFIGPQLSLEMIANIAAARELEDSLREKETAIEFEISLIGMSQYEQDMAQAEEAAKQLAKNIGVLSAAGTIDNDSIKSWLAAEKNKIQTLHDEEMALKAAELALESWQQQHEDATKGLLKYTQQLENFGAAVKDMERAQARAGMSEESKFFDDMAERAKAAVKAGKIASEDQEDYRRVLVATAVAQGDLTTAREADIQKTIEQAKANQDVWKGFSAGLLEAIQNTKTLGDLGYDLAGQFTSGLKGTFSAIFKGEFDTIGDLWKTTLNSMLDSVIDWAAQAASEFVIEQSVDFLFGEGTAAKMGLGSGPTGAKGDPVYVAMDGMSGEEAASKASGTSSALSNLFEMGTAWDTIATGLGDGLNSALDDSWFINESGSSFDNAWWNTATVDDFFDYGTSAMDAGSSQWDNIFTQDPGTGTAWDNVLGDITFDDMLAETETSWSSTMDSIKTTWETVKPAIGAAAGAYGIYSGIEQGGVGGTFQAAGGAMSMYTAGVDAGLYEASAMMGTAGAALGAAGGLYGVYQGVESGNYVQAAGGAVQAYQGANALAPEIGTAISEGFGSLTGGLIGTTAASTAAATGGAYAATSAASTAAQLAAAESAAAAGGAAMSSMAGPIGMAVAMGMAIYQSETEDKFEYESSYGGFEVAEKGQDRGSALVRSMDTIMEDLAASVEAGASAVNYVPDEMVQRANQHLEVLWTEFGEGMAGMALAVEPSLNSFDQYVQATTNAHLSTQELSWMMEKATEASFGNIEAVQSLEYYMVTLGQSTVEASVSAAGMISAMGEASTGMTAAGQTYYATLAQMTAGTSDFDGTVRELQATLGITDEVTRDLSGTLEGAAGRLDSYGNVITDVGGDASEASTYMEQFGSAVRGMSDEAIAAANAFNGIVMQAPQGFSERGAQGNYNKDGAVYSYHASGGVMNRPTVFHVGGEAGDEAIVPLHNGPNTLKLMDDKIDALANRPVQVTIVGDEAGLRKFIRVESDDLVTSKLQRGQGTERVEF